jgi:hypothetical protein
MSHFARKATLAATAFAMVGSTVFGGAALATDYKKDFKENVKKSIFTGGDGGRGGDADTTCISNVTGAILFLPVAPVTEPTLNSNYCPAAGGDANGAPAIDAAPSGNGGNGGNGGND